jgi:hypothetical protein
MSYTWEKTYSAVLTLSGGTRSLQSRLADAYIGALMRLKREDFPAKLREKFDEIESVPAGRGRPRHSRHRHSGGKYERP